MTAILGQMPRQTAQAAGNRSFKTKHLTISIQKHIFLKLIELIGWAAQKRNGTRKQGMPRR
jgi:hypothetical protein